MLKIFQFGKLQTERTWWEHKDHDLQDCGKVEHARFSPATLELIFFLQKQNNQSLLKQKQKDGFTSLEIYLKVCSPKKKAELWI